MKTDRQTQRAIRPALWQLPSMRALCIQLVAFVLVLWLQILSEPVAPALPFIGWSLLQGGLALLLSWRLLAPWWRPIQFGFAPALVLVQALALPPAFFLGGFVVMALLFWSCFRTQVPYFPSNRASHVAVAELLPAASCRFLDVGSGFGGMVTDFARRHPDSQFAGIEIAPFPWAVSVMRARFLSTRPRFIRKDYHLLDFSDFDIVYCYLSPAAMPALWRKARQEMAAGSLLISNEFSIHEAPLPDIVETDGSARKLYVWRM